MTTTYEITMCREDTDEPPKRHYITQRVSLNTDDPDKAMQSAQTLCDKWNSLSKKSSYQPVSAVKVKE